MPKLIDLATREERELVKAVTLIGRAEYCDICIPDRIVSREHARIRKRLTGCYIEDLGSTHGTRVNDVRIRKRAKLHDGDVIIIAAIPAKGDSSSVVRRPHLDTSTPRRQTPPRGAVGDQQARYGARFLFRK